jgi:protein-disulfide isomerase
MTRMRSRVTMILGSVGIALAAITQYRIMARLTAMEKQLQAIRDPRPSLPGRAAQRAPRPPSELPVEPVPLAGASLKGNAAAPVAIIAYSDFQCPFCARFAQTTFHDLETQYISTGKAVFAFRHLPLSSLHPQAQPAAVAAACAGRQGKFWEMHDRLFGEAKRLNDSSWPTLARQLKLDADVFSRCLDTDGPVAVRGDLQTAQELQITGTPTFLIGTVGADGRVTVRRRLSGAQPVEEFRKALEPLFAERRTN